MKTTIILCLIGAVVALPLSVFGQPDASEAPYLRQFGVPLTDLPGPDISQLPIPDQEMMVRLMDSAPSERPPLAVCFAEGTDEEVVRIVSQIIYGVNGPLAYQGGTRWSSTAHGGTGGQGDPITITYSFVPDGVSVPNGIGEGVAPSELYAHMNALFGSEAVWRSKFAQVFARWSDLCGVTYLEVSDDGAPLFSSPGVLGLRGDVRICMKPLDGAYGVLAYNYFPNTGDMVLDRDENWSLSYGDYLFMRNIVAHEHGHGLGLQHVCPINQTKLLEPYLALVFDGPQHDDIRGNQRSYGDTYENNNSAGTATDLGPISGDFTLPNASSDDNSDVDWYRFTAGFGQQVSITLDVLGMTYLDGPQNGDGSCSPGSQINTLDDNDLAIRLYDSTGTQLLAEAASQPAGVDEIIPNTALPGSGNYYIEVLSGSSNAVQLYDVIINVSVLSIPVLSVTEPNGGESWPLGTTQTITWNSLNLSGNLRIELNRSFPTGAWEPIDSSTENDGSEAWVVSGDPGASCLLRILSVNMPAVGDSSDGVFALVAPPPPVTDLVIQASGSDLVFHWTPTGASNYSIFSAPGCDGPFTNLVGTSGSNSLTIVNAVAGSDTQFYVVIAENN